MAIMYKTVLVWYSYEIMEILSVFYSRKLLLSNLYRTPRIST
jgi:hypothetical protein